MQIKEPESAMQRHTQGCVCVWSMLTRAREATPCGGADAVSFAAVVSNDVAASGGKVSETQRQQRQTVKMIVMQANGKQNTVSSRSSV